MAAIVEDAEELINTELRFYGEPDKDGLLQVSILCDGVDLSTYISRADAASLIEHLREVFSL